MDMDISVKKLEESIRSLNDMIKREKQQFEKDKEKTNAILINNFKLKYNYQEEESNSSSLRKQYQGITENLKSKEKKYMKTKTDVNKVREELLIRRKTYSKYIAHLVNDHYETNDILSKESYKNSLLVAEFNRAESEKSFIEVVTESKTLLKEIQKYGETKDGLLHSTDGICGLMRAKNIKDRFFEIMSRKINQSPMEITVD